MNKRTNVAEEFIASLNEGLAIARGEARPARMWTPDAAGRMREHRYYPALLMRDADTDTGYGVVFPDLPGCTSAGDTLDHATECAAEALALHIEGAIAGGFAVPPPSAPDAALPDWLAFIPGSITARVLVPVEMARTNETRSWYA